MSRRVDPTLPARLQKMGLMDNSKCFNCGHCTAVCQLTEENFSYPRKDIRLLQMGVSDALHERVEPWLCYYCGDCTKSCPRDANPAEQMMTLRRYLTAAYDWTGLAWKFYTNKAWEIGALVVLALIVVGLFVVPHLLNPGQIRWEPLAGGVAVSSFAAVSWVHLGDLVMLGLLSFLLLSNIFRMGQRILGGSKVPIPAGLFISEAWHLVVHFVTQRNFKKCEDKKVYWLVHLLLMSGYAIMFLLVIVFLSSLQADTGLNWTTVPGYYATFALLYASIYFLRGRSKKDDEVNRYSTFSDWLFPALLFASAFTGILMHIFRYYMTWPAGTYVMYVVHMAIVVPMLMIEVPFSKWSHLAYRPFAIYFANIRSKAQRAAGKAQPGTLGVPPAVSNVVEV
jgi:ferredoxin